MNNHFLLDLDTTAPNVEIYAPYFTTPTATVYIFIEADEPLDNWQEIYTIDSEGTRRDYIFSFDGNAQFTGAISMIDYHPEGNVAIYARVRDTVHNTSHLVEKTMLVTLGDKIYMTIRDFLPLDTSVRDLLASNISALVRRV